mgnify:FL=1|jgi:hypothetical protein
MNLKKIAYWSSYILPGRPTVALINEYRKPKGERSSLKIRAGLFGTAFLTAKILAVATGAITVKHLDYFNLLDKKKTKNNLEQVLEQDSVFPVDSTSFYNE